MVHVQFFSHLTTMEPNFTEYVFDVEEIEGETNVEKFIEKLETFLTERKIEYYFVLKKHDETGEQTGGGGNDITFPYSNISGFFDKINETVFRKNNEISDTKWEMQQIFENYIGKLNNRPAPPKPTPTITQSAPQPIPTSIITQSAPQTIPTPIITQPAPQTIPTSIITQPAPQTIPTPTITQPAPQPIPTPIITQPAPQTIPTPIITQPAPQTIPTPIITQPAPQTIPTPIITQAAEPTQIQLQPIIQAPSENIREKKINILGINHLHIFTSVNVKKEIVNMM
jgi:hypothetical protein